MSGSLHDQLLPAFGGDQVASNPPTAETLRGRLVPVPRSLRSRLDSSRADGGPRRLGISFSGVGIRAVFEAGIMARLSGEPGFAHPRVMTGFSHGAINAALFAAGRTPESVREFWWELSCDLRPYHRERGITACAPALVDAARLQVVRACRATSQLLNGEAVRHSEALFDASRWLSRHLEEWTAAVLPDAAPTPEAQLIRGALVAELGGESVDASECLLCMQAVDVITGDEVRFVTTPPLGLETSASYTVVPEITVDMVLAGACLPSLSAPIAWAGRLLWGGGRMPLAPLLAAGADSLLLMLGGLTEVRTYAPGVDARSPSMLYANTFLEASYCADRRRLLAFNRIALEAAGVVELGLRRVRLYEPLRPPDHSGLLAADLSPLRRSALERAFSMGRDAASHWLGRGPIAE